MPVSDKRLKIGSKVRLKTGDLAYQGVAIAHLNDQVIFVFGAAPNEELEAIITAVKRNYAEAKLEKIIQPSPVRVDPLCPHFIEGCGGCQWQQISYEAQLEAKAEILKEALKRIGKISEIPQLDIIPCSKPYGFRNRLTLHIKDNKIGLYSPGSRKIQVLNNCLILNEITANVCQNILKLKSSGSSQGVITIQGHEKTAQILISIQGRYFSKSFLKSLKDLCQAEAPQEMESQIVGLVQIDKNRAIPLFGKDHLELEVLGQEFYSNANCFVQTNDELSEKMYSKIISLISGAKVGSTSGKGVLIDVYCGIGITSLLLADRFSTVIGLEKNPSAVKLARLNAQQLGKKNVQFIAGSAEETLPNLGNLITKFNFFKEQKEIDTIILNPPRAGANREVLQAGLDLNPKQIILVYCDPIILARDLSYLFRTENYKKKSLKIDSITVCDMFPQSFHFETILRISFLEK